MPTGSIASSGDSETNLCLVEVHSEVLWGFCTPKPQTSPEQPPPVPLAARVFPAEQGVTSSFSAALEILLKEGSPESAQLNWYCDAAEVENMENKYIQSLQIRALVNIIPLEVLKNIKTT
jgi:hypothetical protein